MLIFYVHQITNMYISFPLEEETKIQTLFYLSQSSFALPQRTVENNSSKLNLMNQILKDVENRYRKVGTYDLSYDVSEELCLKAWDEDFNFSNTDRSKRKE